MSWALGRKAASRICDCGAMPFLAPVVGAQRMADLSRLLADRANVELLIDRIEEMAAERDG